MISSVQFTILVKFDCKFIVSLLNSSESSHGPVVDLFLNWC